MSDIVLVWNEEEGVGFINKIAGLICVVKTIDHKNLSYRSDINYVKLLHMSMKSKEINAIIDKSQRIFNKKVIELRDTYDKSYIFGRGPSLDNAYKYNYHDGVRIVANQIVKDVNLMGHINPHFIVACDHAWHFGCSKVADYYRRDLMSYVKKNDVLYVIPLDSYPLILFHYPELKNNIIAVPYKGNNHIFDLTINYYTMGSLGVLFEFQFPIACTVSKNIVMLGFDGQAPMVKSDVVYPYSRVATYPKEIVNSIYAARPGYYDKDLSEFKDEFSKLLGSMINDAEEQGFEIKTLAPSYHLALSDKFLES